jgi:hypothetical protein
MAKKTLVDSIIKLYSKLGGNISDVLGTRSNVNFLGTGKSPEGFIDGDINIEAIGVLGKTKILDELKSSMGYLTSDKLNDVQASKLYENMTKIDEVLNPKQIPNITDMATGIRNLDQEGIASLRAEQNLADDVVKDVSDMEFDIRSQFPKASEDEIRALVNRVESEVPKRPANYDELSMDDRRLNDIEAENIYRQILKEADDLPPPGSRGGADDIAAPIQDAETTIRNLEAQDPELASQFRKIVLSNQGDAPGKRASAREFLVEALKEDDVVKSGNTFSDFITAEDFKYVTEGGGGIAGDPLLLVEKYFGPRIADMIPANANSEEIVVFTKRVLNNVVDAAGNRPDSPRFDRFTARFIDEVQDFAKGGLAKILEV